jgi:hypothetical protein
MMKHREVKIETKKGTIKADAGIVSLVRALNEFPEITTCSSCECDSGDGLAWVAFAWARGYRRAHLVCLLDALEKRIPRDPDCYMVLTMHWARPMHFPPAELRCSPNFVEEVSETVLRFAKRRPAPFSRKSGHKVGTVAGREKVSKIVDASQAIGIIR